MAVELNGLSPTIVEALQTRGGGTAAGVKALNPATIAQDLKVDIDAVVAAQGILAAVLERSTQAAEVVHGSVQAHLAATDSTQGRVSHGGKRLTELPVAGVSFVDGGLVARFESVRPLSDKEHRQVTNGLKLLSEQPNLLEKLLGPGWRMTTREPVESMDTVLDAPATIIRMREGREGQPRVLLNLKHKPPSDAPVLKRIELSLSGAGSSSNPLAALAALAAESPTSPPSSLTPTSSITSRSQKFVFEKLAADGVSLVEEFRLEIEARRTRHLAGDQKGTETTVHTLYAEGLGDASGMALQILQAVGIDLTKGSSKSQFAAGLGLVEP